MHTASARPVPGVCSARGASHVRCAVHTGTDGLLVTPVLKVPAPQPHWRSVLLVASTSVTCPAGHTVTGEQTRSVLLVPACVWNVWPATHVRIVLQAFSPLTSANWPAAGSHAMAVLPFGQYWPTRHSVQHTYGTMNQPLSSKYPEERDVEHGGRMHPWPATAATKRRRGSKARGAMLQTEQRN